MKYAYFGIGIISLGLIGIVFIFLFQSLTINNETEYYILKEAMEAAMLEAVDYNCYRNTNATGCGETLKISEQKFVENFTRRFVENITGDVNSYKLEFYDIIESPPKASIIVKGKTKSYSILAYEKDDGTKSEGKFEIVNDLSAILEYEPVKKVVTNKRERIIYNSDDGEIKIEVVTISQEAEVYDDSKQEGEADDAGENFDASTDKEETAEDAANATADSTTDEAVTSEDEEKVNEINNQDPDNVDDTNIEGEDIKESDVEETTENQENPNNEEQ